MMFIFIFTLISLVSSLPTSLRSKTSGMLSLWTTSGARLNFVSPQTGINGGFATTNDSTQALAVEANQDQTGTSSLAVTGSSIYVGTGSDSGSQFLTGITLDSPVWNVDSSTGTISSANGLIPFVTSDDDYSSVWLATSSGTIPSRGQAVNIVME